MKNIIAKDVNKNNGKEKNESRTDIKTYIYPKCLEINEGLRNSPKVFKLNCKNTSDKNILCTLKNNNKNENTADKIGINELSSQNINSTNYRTISTNNNDIYKNRILNENNNF